MSAHSIAIADWHRQVRWLPHRDKKPYSAKTGRAASWSDPAAWSDRATAASVGGKSVGVVVGDGLVCVDLDNCLWVDSSGAKPIVSVKPAFKPLFDLACKKRVYVEISQSGRGLHIFLMSNWSGSVKAKFPQRLEAIENGRPIDDARSGGGVEIYGGRHGDGRATRFIAVTSKTGSCGSAQAITKSDEVLDTALALAEMAKAETEAMKKGVTDKHDTDRGLVGVTIPENSNRANTDDDNEEAVAPLTTGRTKDGPLFLVNRLAVIGADLWFPVLFKGARKHGEVWRATTPGASRGDISISPKGIRWWKDDEVKTPVDVVMLFADPDRELTAAEAAAWLAETLTLQAPALRGLATMLARNSHEAPVDLFTEMPDTVMPWPVGTLPTVLESYAYCMSQELGVNDSVLSFLFLIACGASVPAGIRFQPDPAKSGWIVPATAWGMVLAPSGSAKSPALDAALAPIYEVEERWRDEHKARVKASDEKGEKERLQKRGPKRRVTNGCTSEALIKLFAGQPEGVILHSDELAGAFDSIGKYNRGSHGGHSDSAVMLTAYESKSFSLDRKDEGRSVSAERAHLSLVGGVQPPVLAGMAESLSSNGMLQRALIATMTTSLYGPPCEDVVGRNFYHGIVRQIFRLGDLGCAEALIVGSPEVGAAMIEEGNRARAMISNDPTLSDTAKGVLGKTTGHIARLALWLAMIDWAARNYEAVEILDDDPVELPTTISIETFRSAARIWWEYCFPTMRHVYDGTGLSSSVLNDARHLAAYILGREEKFAQPFGSRAFRDIRKFSGQVGAGRLFAALDYLAERRWLHVLDRQTSGAPTYTVDDRVWTLFGDRAATLQGRWA